MSKIKIEYKINEISKNELIGILNKNKIIFKDGLDKITFTIHEESLEIEKESSEGILNLYLKKNNSAGIYKINDVGEVILNPILKSYYLGEKEIKINYTLNNNNINIEIKYEVIK